MNKSVCVHILVKAALVLFATVSLFECTYSQAPQLKQYIFFGMDRESIHEDSFLLYNPRIEGAEVSYAWRQLEPGRGQYDFSRVEEDLRFLAGKGKKLFVMISDATFYDQYNAVPAYMLSDTAFHGGQEKQCMLRDNGTESCHGYYARRWDPAVRAQFIQLIKKFSAYFDGKIAGITIEETAIDVSSKHPMKGFSNEAYLAGIKEYMQAFSQYFKQSVPLLFANFMPGGIKYLQAVYAYAKLVKIGMGGPDIKVYKAYQMANSYPLIRDLSGIVPTGVAVEDGNYDEINGKTKKKVTVQEILDFARNYLKLNYIFWCREEPHYSKEVIPLLNQFELSR